MELISVAEWLFGFVVLPFIIWVVANIFELKKQTSLLDAGLKNTNSILTRIETLLDHQHHQRS